jgi:tetratricopeptide (TPR) repeat protein
MKYLLYSVALFFALLLCISCGNHGDGKKANAESDTSSVNLESINSRLRDKPGSGELYQARAKYYMGQKDMKSALADIIRALKIDSTHADYYLTLADICFVENKTGSSKAALEKCHMLDPKNSACIMKLAELYFYVRKYQESLNYLDEALKLDTYNAKAYFMKGMNFKEAGDTAKAISSMQTAVEQDNNYFNAFIQLGLISAAQHNRVAEDYYSNALRIQPNSTEALYDFAKLYQDEKNYPKATELYKHLLLLDKKNFDALYNMGVISVNTKTYEDALKCFSDAIGSAPKNPRGYYGRGYCYQIMGQIQNASADYRYSLTLDPNFELSKEGLKQIKVY